MTFETGVGKSSIIPVTFAAPLIERGKEGDFEVVYVFTEVAFRNFGRLTLSCLEIEHDVSRGETG